MLFLFFLIYFYSYIKCLILSLFFFISAIIDVETLNFSLTRRLLNPLSRAFNNLFHPVSNFNTLRHQFESGKTQKTAGRRLSVAIGNTKVTIVQIAITIIQV
jgi:hypothetical protein